MGLFDVSGDKPEQIGEYVEDTDVNRYLVHNQRVEEAKQGILCWVVFVNNKIK